MLLVQILYFGFGDGYFTCSLKPTKQQNQSNHQPAVANTRNPYLRLKFLPTYTLFMRTTKISTILKLMYGQRSIIGLFCIRLFSSLWVPSSVWALILFLDAFPSRSFFSLHFSRSHRRIIQKKFPSNPKSKYPFTCTPDKTPL